MIQHFPDGGANLWFWGENLLFAKIFAENCMKMKEHGPIGPIAPLDQKFDKFDSGAVLGIAMTEWHPIILFCQHFPRSQQN